MLSTEGPAIKASKQKCSLWVPAIPSRGQQTNKTVKAVKGTLTELADDMLLREQFLGVDVPLEVLFQSSQDDRLLLWPPDTPCQQHVP